jgi:exopolyphosphatase/guanosine-5'-triphosphate,3'-diphosphate pyrophosphatase
VAVVDLGTNSCRLLLAQVEGGRVTTCERVATVTRLGEGVDRRRALNAAAVRRTTECLDVYARRIERFAPERRQLIATSVLRDVADGQAYLDGLQRRFGLPWRILDGDEEAALGFTGAASGVAVPPVAERSDAPAFGRLAVLDVGGGSTELSVGPLPMRHRSEAASALPTPDWTRSLDVGSVRLTERFLLSDPPAEAEWRDAERFTRELLERRLPDDARSRIALVVGVAGTITTIVAYKLGLRRYDPELVHGHRLSLADIERAITVFRSLTSEQRAGLPGIQRGREDVIPAGALIAREACRLLSVDGLVASEADVLDGVALLIADGR